MASKFEGEFAGVTFDATGEAMTTLFIRDVTERKRSEAEREEVLREVQTERALLEAVLEQMPSGVIIAEAPSGRIY